MPIFLFNIILSFIFLLNIETKVCGVFLFSSLFKSSLFFIFSFSIIVIVSGTPLIIPVIDSYFFSFDKSKLFKLPISFSL